MVCYKATIYEIVLYLLQVWKYWCLGRYRQKILSQFSGRVDTYCRREAPWWTEKAKGRQVFVFLDKGLSPNFQGEFTGSFFFHKRSNQLDGLISYTNCNNSDFNTLNHVVLNRLMSRLQILEFWFLSQEWHRLSNKILKTIVLTLLFLSQ